MGIVSPAGSDSLAPPDSIPEIHAFISAVTARRRRAAALEWATSAVTVLSSLVLTVRALCYVGGYAWKMPSSAGWALLTVYAISAAVAIGAGRLLQHDPMTIARLIDERLQLKDRVASALSVRLKVSESSFAYLIAADAADSLRNTTPTDIVALRWTRRQTLAVIATVLAVAAAAITQIGPQWIGRPSRVVASGAAGPLAAGHVVMPVPEPAMARPRGLRGSTTQLQRSDGLLDRMSGATSKADGAAGAPKNMRRAPASGSPLGDRLRHYADRLASRTLTSGESASASTSLDRLRAALTGAAMPQTQRHLTSASQDLADTQQRRAITEIRSAASSADQEAATNSQTDTGSGPQEGSGTNGRAVGQSGSSGRSNSSQQGGGLREGLSDSDSSTGAGPASSEARANNGDGGTGTGPGAGRGRQVQTANGGPGPIGSTGFGSGGGTQRPHFGAVHPIDPSKLGPLSSLPPIRLPETGSGRSSDTPGAPMAGLPGGRSTVSSAGGGSEFSAAPDKGEPAVDDRIPPTYRGMVEKYFAEPTPH